MSADEGSGGSVAEASAAAVVPGRRPLDVFMVGAPAGCAFAGRGHQALLKSFLSEFEHDVLALLRKLFALQRQRVELGSLTESGEETRGHGNGPRRRHGR